MKKRKILLVTVLSTFIVQTQAQNLFVDLLTSASSPTTANIPAPTGYSYSGAAPVAGTYWNTVGESSIVPANQTASSVYTLYTGLPLVNSLDASSSATLTVTYTATVGNGTRTQPSGGTGENTIQAGGSMQQAWRNYFNASGNYFTFTISGLTASTPYDLYFEGGTTGTGQGAGASLAAGNILGANPGSATTANSTANSNGAFGSLFTSNGSGGYQLMAEGTTWEILHGESDASGNFSFNFTKIDNNNQAYMNGFQLVAPVPEPSALALAGIGLAGLIWNCRRPRK